MSADKNEKNEYEFIKEEVIPKKRKKVRKILLPLVMTIFMAMLFGVVAAATFVISEPVFFKFLNRKEEAREPIIFPTVLPDDTTDDNGVNGKDNMVNNKRPTPTVTPVNDDDQNDDNHNNDDQSDNDQIDNDQKDSDQKDNGKVIINTIDADIDDLIMMSEAVKEIADEVSKSIVTVTCIRSGNDIFGGSIETRDETSGLILVDDGKELYILVSMDRVMDTSSIKVKLSEADIVDAVLLDYETEVNLAVITISINDIPQLLLDNMKPAIFGSSYLTNIGSPIIALGCPNGNVGSMDYGIITSKDSPKYITDYKLDLFNTGIKDSEDGDGYIVNLKGQVIGIITRTLKDDHNEDINTAISISRLNPLIARMINRKSHIYCGVVAVDLTEEARVEHQVANGIYVSSVRADSPAFDAGIKGGDIIMSVDNKSVLNTIGFFNIISDYEPGSDVSIKIKRTSGTTAKEMELKVTLAARGR